MWYVLSRKEMYGCCMFMYVSFKVGVGGGSFIVCMGDGSFNMNMGDDCVSFMVCMGECVSHICEFVSSVGVVGWCPCIVGDGGGREPSGSAAIPHVAIESRGSVSTVDCGGVMGIMGRGGRGAIGVGRAVVVVEFAMV